MSSLINSLASSKDISSLVSADDSSSIVLPSLEASNICSNSSERGAEEIM